MTKNWNDEGDENINGFHHLASVYIDKESSAVDRSCDKHVIADMTVDTRHFSVVSRLAGCYTENTGTRLEVQQLHCTVGIANTYSLPCQQQQLELHLTMTFICQCKIFQFLLVPELFLYLLSNRCPHFGDARHSKLLQPEKREYTHIHINHFNDYFSR